MKLALWLIFEILLVFRLPTGVRCQINRAPHFILGGDMARFSISEDTIPGTIIYTLRGIDPEFTNVSYSISGQYLTVDKYTGNVTLIKSLDREHFDALEVIISITDEPLYGLSDSNTISVKREIPILDVNDNVPEFVDRPYYVSVPENTKSIFPLYSNITIIDRDAGLNSEIKLTCVSAPIDCDLFSIYEQKVSEGIYKGTIVLLKPLDYESKSSYNLILKATDSNPKYRLSSTAIITIEIEDVQDQPPIFIGAPYTVPVQENIPEGQNLLTVEAKDGDTKNLRPITFSIENDQLGYFQIINHGQGVADIITTNVTIDREHPFIADNANIYTFVLKATELINNQIPDDESFETVTVIVSDADDQEPIFNSPSFKINISEDHSKGTPLPGFAMIVTDKDDGENGKFYLAVQSVTISIKEKNQTKFESKSAPDDWFSVEPVEAVEKTAVVIRLTNSSCFDYDDSSNNNDNNNRKNVYYNVRQIRVRVTASVEKNNSFERVSSSELVIDILDANDNAPVFRLTDYVMHVSEDASPGTRLSNITGDDNDSGLFGRLTYGLNGFGIDKFSTHVDNGGIILIGKLDYEQQTSYYLTMEASDGGGISSTTNILILVEDVNDNAPIFEQTEYRRIVREGSTAFYPQLFAKATDVDYGRNSLLCYTVQANNTDVFDLNENTGELTFKIPASSKHTQEGRYELKIRVTDAGIPPLYSVVDVFIRVGISGNQKPIFKGTPYIAAVSELAKSGTPVITVIAFDPDGLNHLEYRLIAGADNFDINPESGQITVSKSAVLDVDITRLDRYKLSVLAIDKGVPFPETAEMTVVVNILDVNNKAPYFPEADDYVCHISEDSLPGETIFKAKAIDLDADADIRYKILSPVIVRDKRNLALPNYFERYFQSIFLIDEKTGAITVNGSLNRYPVSTITITVEATDENAVVDVAKQFDRVDITFYVESSGKIKPIFDNGPWSISNQIITASVPEETAVGFIILRLTAFESITGELIRYFRTVSAVPKELMFDSSGIISVAKRIDYETIRNKTLIFGVEAFTNDNVTRSFGKVVVDVMDINDHVPKFRNQSYRISIRENLKKDTIITTVEATDGDLGTSPTGFGTVRYSLSGEYAFLFKIDSETGAIKVSNDDDVIDRECTSTLHLSAVAYDTPAGGIHQRRTSVSVIIDVIDVNDNVPIFDDTPYSTVILEDAVIGTDVLNITATDLDEGISGRVTYRITTESDVAGLFHINSTTGRIKTAKSLVGKGRKDPYIVTIAAEDGGDPILSSETLIEILVADVTVNDGIPLFIRPTSNEIVYVSENSSVGSIVFQVKAIDPDDIVGPEGKLRYTFLDDANDFESFHIDSESGSITIRLSLDRETKNHYYLVIVAKDLAVMPQQTTRVLHVVVTDVDDNVPVLRTHPDDNPILMTINEEVPTGTVVGSLRAYDADSDDNAVVGFLIIDGNKDGLFSIEEIDPLSAVIKVSSRIDKETASTITLTVKCVKFSDKPTHLEKSFNKHDMSEQMLVIKILDIDDNAPEFERQNVTIGVRSNIGVDTLLLSLKANDVDVNSGPIIYRLRNCTYVFPRNMTVSTFECSSFNLNNETGEVRSVKSLAGYADGYFLLTISASNNGYASNRSYVYVKMFINHQRSFLRFVFDLMPSEVKSSSRRFIEDMEDALSRHALKFNSYDIHFHSYEDGSIDLTRTSSCFQIVSENGNNPSETEVLLKNVDGNIKLRKTYEKYSVQSIEHCGPNVAATKSITWIRVSAVAIAVITTVLFTLLICFVCCLYTK